MTVGVAAALASVAVLAGVVGCDQGTQHDQPTVVGGPVHLIGTNVATQGIPPNGRIELAFDRLLLPLSISRQTFVLTALNGGAPTPDPIVSYDPVTRIVTILPNAALANGMTYRLTITSAANAADGIGLRAIDGAGPDPSVTAQTISVAIDSTVTQTAAPTVDFCADIGPLFQGSCGAQGVCHGAPASPKLPLSAEGLLLDSNAGILATATSGRVAQESNQGSLAQPESSGLRFAVDMPIIDTGDVGAGSADSGTATGATVSGSAADSYLLYKILLAAPATAVSHGQECDGGPPTDVTTAHILPQCDGTNANACWSPLTAAERGVLADFMTGREMPFPSSPAVSPEQNVQALSLQSMESVSLWINQARTAGTPLVPASCTCTN